jgi:hypothetical protein
MVSSPVVGNGLILIIASEIQSRSHFKRVDLISAFIKGAPTCCAKESSSNGEEGFGVRNPGISECDES